jgi:hypothetical protein
VNGNLVCCCAGTLCVGGAVAVEVVPDDDGAVTSLNATAAPIIVTQNQNSPLLLRFMVFHGISLLPFFDVDARLRPRGFENAGVHLVAIPSTVTAQ